MLQHLEAFECLASSAGKVMAAGAFGELLKSQVLQLKRVCEKCDIVPLEAASCMSAIDSSKHLTPQQKEDLSASIASRLGSESTVEQNPLHSGTKILQQNEYFHQYLTQSEWSSLVHETMTAAEKLMVLINRCFAIGLLYPTESTCKSIVAVLVAAHPSTLTVAQTYDLLLDFKAKIKAQRQFCRLEFSPPKIYTENSRDFADAHSSAYANDCPPVKSPIDNDRLRSVLATVPVRKTKQSLHAKKPPPLLGCVPRHAPESTPGFNMMMPMMIASAKQMFSQKDTNAPNLILTPPKESLKLASIADCHQDRLPEQSPAELSVPPEPVTPNSAPRVQSSCSVFVKILNSS